MQQRLRHCPATPSTGRVSRVAGPERTSATEMPEDASLLFKLSDVAAAATDVALASGTCREREIFIDNLLVRVHLIIEMSRPALRHGSLISGPAAPPQVVL